MGSNVGMFAPLSEEEAEDFRADLDLLREDIIDGIWMERYVEDFTKAGNSPKIFPGLGVGTPQGYGIITNVFDNEVVVELLDTESITRWRLDEVVAPWQNPPILKEEEVVLPSRQELLAEALEEAGWDEERIRERIAQEKNI